MKRRNFLIGLPFVFAIANTASSVNAEGTEKMFGSIGKMITVEGKRDDLIKILLDGTKDMPGCLSYIIAKDKTDANGIWITEVWKDEESHKASLSLPKVKEAIAKGKPMIAGFGDSVAVEPVGGKGLKT